MRGGETFAKGKNSLLRVMSSLLTLREPMLTARNHSLEVRHPMLNTTNPMVHVRDLLLNVRNPPSTFKSPSAKGKETIVIISSYDTNTQQSRDNAFITLREFNVKLLKVGSPLTHGSCLLRKRGIFFFK